MDMRDKQKYISYNIRESQSNNQQPHSGPRPKGGYFYIQKCKTCQIIKYYDAYMA